MPKPPFPRELERFTLSPAWEEEQRDEARRRKAAEELRQRTAPTGGNG
jgi:hypothetical protein